MKTWNFDFVGRARWFYALSIGMVVITLICALIFGVELDIQFRGGAMLRYSFTGEALSVEQVEGELGGVISESFNVQIAEGLTSGDKSITISIASGDGLETAEQEAIGAALTAAYPDRDIKLLSSNSIEASAGRDFFLKCIVAVLFTLAVMIVFIAFRFKNIGGWSAGVMGVLALLHDAFFVFATFVLFRMPLNDSFMAVTLTILGYSINDTIVIYDRIRENRRIYGGKMAVRELVNLSINQSFMRTINTSVTTLIAIITVGVVASLFGVTSIISFAFPMTLGLISGVYSTVCIAGPLWVVWQEHKQKLATK